MASYTVAAGAVAAHDKTLVAATVDTVTFTSDVNTVSVLSDGTAAIYFTVDGTTPAASGAQTYKIPAAVAERSVSVPTSDVCVVKLISAGTPIYSVSVA